MATKTLTVTEDAYNLLKEKKLEGESFSEEIKRLLSGREKRALKDYFGVIKKKTGAKMIKDLQKIRRGQRRMLKEKLKDETA